MVQFDPKYVQNLSAALSASSAHEQNLTNELSSGLRVSTLSSDPVAAAENVQLARSISGIDAFTTSSSLDQSLLQVSDSALGEVVTKVQQAISLATSAGNGTLSGANLSAIAKQATDLRDSVVQLANTNYLGQYVFSGSQGNVAAFANDTSTDPATATYQGDSATQSIQTPAGQTIAVNLSGASIFQAPGADLLGTLNQLVSDLNAGDSSGVIADTGQLSTALGNVSQKQSELGSSLSQLNSATSYAATQSANLQAQQSALLSADPAQVATDLSTAETQHQALLSVIAGLSKTDLFSVLQG